MAQDDTSFIPLAQPSLTSAETQAVAKVMVSGFLSQGKEVEAFEEAFAAQCKVPYAVAMSSGTAALHVGVMALSWKTDDEVITSPFSFVASANCLLYEGVKPVFVDVEEESFGMDATFIEAAITDRSVGLLPVHVFGQCCDMTRLGALAQKHQLRVLEDACEAPLATHDGQLAGSMGDVGTFGFYPNKQMTTGEGGMFVTHDETLATIARSLRNQGRSTDAQWLLHERMGFNYRIHELTAAIGRVQVERLPRMIVKRKALAQQYADMLKEIDEIQLPKTMEGNSHSWFVFAIRVSAKHRNPLIAFLAQNQIQSKAYFSPCIHLQPYMQEKFGYQKGMFPVAEKLSEEMLILPFFLDITMAQMERVVHALRAYFTSAASSNT